MTELVIAVRLKADGSGLVGQTRLSKAAVEELKASVAGVAPAAAAAGAATQAMGREAAQAGAAAAGAGASFRQAATDAEKLALAQGRGTKAVNDNIVSLRGQQFAIRNVGQQVGDFGLQVASGQDPARAFSQQIGQLGYAMSELGGRAGKVGAFLTGPWGIALTIGAAALAPLVGRLFEADDAAKAATAGANGLADAQTALGGIFDLVSGKLKVQNELLITNARLTAINLRADAIKKRASFGTAQQTAGQASLFSSFGLGSVPGAVEGLDPSSLTASARGLLDDLAKGRIKAADALKKSERLDLGASSISRTDLQQAIVDFVTARTNDEAAALIDKSLDSGKLADGLKRDAKTPKPKKPPKAKSAAPLAEFGSDAGDRIAAIVDRYSDLPSSVRESNAALRQLKDLTEDIARKKPPGFEKLLDDAARAKTAIEEGINRPFTEVIAQQNQQLRIGDLIAQGREGEAEALTRIIGLEKVLGPIGEGRQAQIRAGVEALREQDRQLEITRRKQENLLRLVSDARSSVASAFAGESSDLVGSLVVSFKRAFAEQLTEKLFGNFFRGLERKIKSADGLDGATQRIVAAYGDGENAVTNFADVVNAAADKIGGGAANSALPGGGSAGGLAALVSGNNSIVNAVTALDRTIGASARRTGTPTYTDANGDIVVTGPSKSAARVNANNNISSVEGLIGKTFGSLLTDGLKIGGVKDSAALKLGTAFSGGLEKVLGGAGTGTAVSGLAQSVGIKLGATGSAIGGAIGSFIPIPGGQIIGSILGGLAENLFTPAKVAKGGAITSVDGKVDVAGNNAEAKDAVSQASKAVQSGISQIAQQLGADVGDFKVSIAKYKDSFRVDPTGSGSDGGKYGDRFVQGIGKFDNNNIDGAIAFAIADAIKDGAIKGISPAVAQALKSNPDINKALKEALKVRDLETLLGGFAGSLKKSFTDFDNLAAERVGLARAYGFDLLQVEKINAEERAKLVNDTLKARVEDLKSFLDSVKYGDLFEGNAADRRRQILAEIDTTKADAEKGVEGAASKLAELYRTLTTISRDAFGTAGGEFTSDRTSAISGAERIIQIEQDRINAASGQSQAMIDGIDSLTSLANEANNLAAINNGKLDTTNALLASLLGGGGSGFSLGGNISLTQRLATDLV